MGRAVKLLKRIADPKDRLHLKYGEARQAMRTKEDRKNRKDRKRAKKPTVAKNNKSA